MWAPSPKSHLNPQLMGETWSKEFAPQQMAGTHHSWVGWCGKMLGGKTITLLDDLNIMPTLVLEFPTFRLRAPSAHHSAPVTTHTHTTHTPTHTHVHTCTVLSQATGIFTIGGQTYLSHNQQYDALYVYDQSRGSPAPFNLYIHPGGTA